MKLLKDLEVADKRVFVRADLDVLDELGFDRINIWFCQATFVNIFGTLMLMAQVQNLIRNFTLREY
jgi:hypothetical protein